MLGLGQGLRRDDHHVGLARTLEISAVTFVVAFVQEREDKQTGRNARRHSTNDANDGRQSCLFQTDADDDGKDTTESQGAPEHASP